MSSRRTMWFIAAALFALAAIAALIGGNGLLAAGFAVVGVAFLIIAVRTPSGGPRP